MNDDFYNILYEILYSEIAINSILFNKTFSRFYFQQMFYSNNVKEISSIHFIAILMYLTVSMNSIEIKIKQGGMKYMKILHISDLHITQNNNKPFANMIIETINNSSKPELNLSPDIILITGDFTNSALPVEFENAKKEIERIKRRNKDCQRMFDCSRKP